ncbi:phosphoribulokinase [Microbulbifer sp. MLAF003]|uniref:phosphoribulokinase n=1 Tax=unclassified Microbulbifer TaxID=2619833 RepID=UPI0024AC9EF8|nr:phosphoribulokinase [Microbulbifer sp. MLAF003]WHI50667.1 phosphoribulokinase [Microbulbifer sp. MLAF003]
MLKTWPESIVERSRYLVGTNLRSSIVDFISQHQLPAEFHSEVLQYYLPLALWLQECHAPGKTLVVGISGGQGTGKSTLTDFIRCVLSEFGLDCCALSLDDIYLTRAERRQLAQDVHPLLQTRGVPGTHDVQMGIDILEALCHASSQTTIALPRFDKTVDERAPHDRWPIHNGKVDIVLFEGWCLGARPMVRANYPLNLLEKTEDQAGIWRNYVNQQLKDHYQQLFDKVEVMVLLKAPDMSSILEWRKLQEQKLRERTGMGMREEELERFVQHYERVTRNILMDMPNWANCVLQLGRDHRIKKVRLRPE